MKKILIILFLSLVILLPGCEKTYNTPTSKVSSFFNNYKQLKKNLLEEMNLAIKKDNSKSNFEKNIYKKLLIKQYKDIDYKIKSEKIRNIKIISYYN